MHCSNATAATSESLTGVNEVTLANNRSTAVEFCPSIGTMSTTKPASSPKISFGDVTLKTTVEEDVKYGAAAVINVSGEVEILRSRAETQ